MSDKQLTGLDMKKQNGFLKSFCYAAQGIASAAQERNFKVDLAVAVCAFVLCALLQVPAWGWVAVAVCVGMVLAAECVNTAIEAVVDLASPDIHPLAKRAKDCAAASALVLAVTSVFVACVVFVPAAYGMLFGA